MTKSIIKLGCLALFAVLVLQSNTNQKQKAETTQTKVTAEEKAKKLISEMEQVNGGWSHLLAKNDVEFTYEYKDYAKGTDISTERIIFQGETSFGKYIKHEANVLPKQKGVATQFMADGKVSTTLDGKIIKDKEASVLSKFMREVNPFWFSMMYKLSDPSVRATFEGVENVNGIDYSKVNIAYSGTGKEADDAYILYFNPKNKLVDFFYFSLPFMGVDKAVLKMELKYEKIDGVLIATERTGIFPNPETGEYKEGGKYLTKNIKFNNGFTKENITK